MENDDLAVARSDGLGARAIPGGHATGRDPPGFLTRLVPEDVSDSFESPLARLVASDAKKMLRPSVVKLGAPKRRDVSALKPPLCPLP